MKIITNEKLIERNRRIGQYVTVASLLVLGGGLYMSFIPELLNWSLVALLIGFVMSQVGIYFGSRWGRSPRPDERLNDALKGLTDQYSLYHYQTPVPHLLVGPAGIWVLMHYRQAGLITFDTKRGRWKQKGGNLYLKLFGQEGLGRPDLDLGAALADLEKHLSKRVENEDLPTIHCALVFSNEKADVQAADAPHPTLLIKKLKEFIRRNAKQSSIPPEKVTALQAILPEA